MQRCVTVAAVMLALSAPAAAQVQRNFPATALRGELVITQPPEALLNGKPARLAPGARIRDQNNLLAQSGALAQARLPVHYTVDAYGLLFDIWVLNPAERARQPWPRTPEEAARWVFDPVGQAWSRP